MQRMSRLELKTPTNDAVKLGALIGKKLLKWPGVNFHPMFGLVALYRNDKIFAVLPHFKAMGSDKAINFYLSSEKNLELALREPYLISDQTASGWFVFEVNTEDDIISGLKWLRRAYEDVSNY